MPTLTIKKKGVGKRHDESKYFRKKENDKKKSFATQ
jgi:hypothetical protein